MAGDRREAAAKIEERLFDLVLLEFHLATNSTENLQESSGFELIERIRQRSPATHIIATSSDNGPETLLRVLRCQVHRFLTKPLDKKALLDAVHAELESPTALPMQVLSAVPGWVEVIAPCDLYTAERIQEFMASLNADLSLEIRESAGQAFRELLLNAMEWGCHFDASHQVRVSCLRGRRMLMFRISDPGSGFSFESLSHASVSNPPNEPLRHMEMREARSMRPGGLGIAMTRGLVDELIYNEANNEVVLIKYLEESAGRSS